MGSEAEGRGERIRGGVDGGRRLMVREAEGWGVRQRDG